MPSDVGQPPIPMFALIIGIDDYANCTKLHGAVADAKSIKQYLKGQLQVSEDHIVTLYDGEATRHAIIKAFRDLQNDERISEGDPIVIFYAGHGGELITPSAWGVESKIQCLIPQDCQVAGTEPIPDRTIGALIEDIAEVKGDNITVIFDCCHAASGTRDQDEYVPRSVDLHLNILQTLDDDIWGNRTGSITNGFSYHDLRSHVLLAACGEKECAYEHNGQGQFTRALLVTLENCAVNDLTYTQLLGGIHLDKQHPRCEGFNQHRVLFDARVPVGGQTCHPVHVHKGSKYVISAGSAHGVSHGMEFALYDDKKRIELGVVQVEETSLIEDFEVTITTSLCLTGASFAKLTYVGRLPLYVEPGGKLVSILAKTSLQPRIGGYFQAFQLVEPEKAKLEAAIQNDQVVFEILDERVRGFGLIELPYKTTLDHLAHVLRSAAHYYWFLGLAKGDDPISTKHEVAVDFYRLMVEYDDYGEPFLFPLEPGLCRKDPSNMDVIDFVVDPYALYGIKITNNTQWDLYLNAFLFNNSSLSIVPYYTQPSVDKPGAPLERGGTFTIGYGPGGTAPFCYSLEGSQDVDVGFLKIFFSTRPIDLSHIAQPSPFVNTRGETGHEVRLDVSPLKQPTQSVHTWFTLDVPVVQRRKDVHGM